MEVKALGCLSFSFLEDNDDDSLEAILILLMIILNEKFNCNTPAIKKRKKSQKQMRFNRSHSKNNKETVKKVVFQKKAMVKSGGNSLANLVSSKNNSFKFKTPEI